MKIVFSLVVVFIMAQPVHAQTERFALQSNLDHVWTMMAAGLVFFMQAGFLLIEAGSVRAKNSINVAQKNLLDFLLSTAAFGLVGYALMFGQSYGGLIGWSHDLAFFRIDGDWNLTFFVFQLVFCGTAATVVSGAVAERMSMGGYILMTLTIGLVLYPVAGHWTWGGLLSGSQEPFLARMGFIDFAGSTVVHSMGAWCALAAVIVLGPRRGKYDADGKPVELHGHSPILTTLGALVLWVGWIGFNGGSTTAGTPAFAHIIVNTMLAGAFGGVAQFLLGYLLKGYNRPEFMINGLLGGLVAITAGCDAVTPQGAVCIGLAGGVITFVAREFLESRMRLDDPVGAIAVHGAAGALGTILVGVLAQDAYLLAGSRLAQIGIQAMGVGVYFLWAFGLMFTVLKCAHWLLPAPEGSPSYLRVPRQDEDDGLNMSEHRAPLGLAAVSRAMQLVIDDPKAEFEAIHVEPGDEAYDLAVQFNQIMERLRERVAQERAQSASASEIDSFLQDLTDVMTAYRQGDFTRSLDSAKLPRQFVGLGRTINDMGQEVHDTMDELRIVIEALAQGDLSRRMGGDKTGVFNVIQSKINFSLSEIASVMGDVEQAVTAASAGDFSTNLRTQGRHGYLQRLSQGINAINHIATEGLADIASVMEQMAKGNLTCTMRDNHQGAFGVIAQDVNRSVSQLRDMIEETRSSLEKVFATFQMIENQTARVTEAARSNEARVKALSAALTQAGAQISGNDARIREAHDQADTVHKALERSRAISATTVLDMEAANEAVQKITSSLSQIDDVASQTHLLSLNASVEAARAGSNGVGFAVVAGEVRQLATRSAQTAQGVSHFVEAVQTKVKETANGVHETGNNLDQVHGSVARTTALFGEISTTCASVATIMQELFGDLDQISRASSESLQTSEAANQAVSNMQATMHTAMGHLNRFHQSDSDLAA
ncbi:hypothetical protein BFP70_08950 [Thioclava sp. SK-1]|uniref:ammonium transporter n=1 Tax=Thioclava sp. SK-1 TaxID=1889770 RepID=UPI0008253B81|nr:ammonium transporter [Thioclava sp. SK-1]OCX65607.1 hypothetical protein BFP70_08950 [Thioclava sp. SK-1]